MNHPLPTGDIPKACKDLEEIQSITESAGDTEELCECKDCSEVPIRYSCYNSECVENRYGRYSSLIDCLDILCQSNDTCNDIDPFFLPTK